MPGDTTLSWLDDVLFSTPEMAFEHRNYELTTQPVQICKLSGLMVGTKADTGLTAIKIGECVATWAVRARMQIAKKEAA